MSSYKQKKWLNVLKSHYSMILNEIALEKGQLLAQYIHYSYGVHLPFIGFALYSALAAAIVNAGTVTLKTK